MGRRFVIDEELLQSIGNYLMRRPEVVMLERIKQLKEFKEEKKKTKK